MWYSFYLAYQRERLKAIFLQLNTQQYLGFIGEKLVDETWKFSLFNSISWDECKSSTFFGHLAVNCDHCLVNRDVVQTAQGCRQLRLDFFAGSRIRRYMGRL